MDPQIIPYGWGLFSEGEEVVKTTATKNFEGNGKQNNSSFMFYISNTIEDIYTFFVTFKCSTSKQDSWSIRLLLLCKKEPHPFSSKYSENIPSQVIVVEKYFFHRWLLWKTTPESRKRQVKLYVTKPLIMVQKCKIRENVMVLIFRRFTLILGFATCFLVHILLRQKVRWC